MGASARETLPEGGRQAHERDHVSRIAMRASSDRLELPQRHILKGLPERDTVDRVSDLFRRVVLRLGTPPDQQHMADDHDKDLRTPPNLRCPSRADLQPRRRRLPLRQRGTSSLEGDVGLRSTVNIRSERHSTKSVKSAREPTTMIGNPEEDPR